MPSTSCPKCASVNLMTGVEIRDYGNQGAAPLRVYINEPEPPNHGLIWKQGQSSGTVRATICANCGYTELYTDNLAALYKSYKMSHP